MLALSEISAQCTAHGSLTHVWLLDPEHVTAEGRRWLGAIQGAITSSESAVVVDFTQGSASYRCVPAASDTGRSYTSEVSLTVSRGQISVDALVRRLQDHTVHVLFKDTAGTVRVLWHARLKCDFEIPQNLGGRQQYNATFYHTESEPARIYIGAIP